MKVAIVGSRKYKDKEKVIKLLRQLPKDTIIVSGGCEGVDTWAEEAAKQKNMKTIIFRPDEKQLKKAKSYFEIIKCFYERNKKIAQEADIIYAFPAPNRKGGTENTIMWAKKFNKKVIIK